MLSVHNTKTKKYDKTIFKEVLNKNAHYYPMWIN